MSRPDEARSPASGARRLASCFLRGLARNPGLALRLAPRLRTDLKSIQRFNVRLHGRDFIADVYAASRSVGIRPFLMWGTLLGWARHRTFIPNDHDIDMGILVSDYGRKDDLLSALVSRGYRVHKNQRYKFSLRHPGTPLGMDIDVFYPWRGKMICTALHEKSGDTVGATFDLDAFSDLRETTFVDGLPVLVPAAAESILTEIYGDWRTPRPDYSSADDLRNRITFRPGEPVPEIPTV